MKEEWRSIKNLPDYQLSNLGNVNVLKGKFSKNDGMYSFLSEGRTIYIPIQRLMRDTWKFEWIKDLDEDEEVKPFLDLKGYYITNKAKIFDLYNYRWLSSSGRSPYHLYFVIKDITYKTHKEVGRHFLPGCEDGEHIKFIDDSIPFPQINFISNLEIGQPPVFEIEEFKYEKYSLSEDEVKEIRILAKSKKMKQKDIAKMFSIPAECVSRIKRRLAYKWVE